MKADRHLRLANALRFIAGISGLFSAFTGSALDVRDLLCVMLAVAMNFICSFELRYKGSQALLWLFAAAGLLVIASSALTPSSANVFVQGLLRLALCALFCLVALHTRPAIEHRKTAA
ncbi:hypothetical protein [Uliginosibacterium sediminicola]|uniref:Uncharacterized protein n=1 Tax=Uliginosibacterium sediminicola TaxID=2024550 RepID=A0ABU9YXI2_9RHOO